MMLEFLCTLNGNNGQVFPADRPGNQSANRPGIQGKLPVRHAGSGWDEFPFAFVSIFGGSALSPMSLVLP
jgi:hypothetical protein